jgi:hypothetical protein
MRSDDAAHREDYQRHEAVRRERDLLRDLLTEASRQDFGTAGWRERVRAALDAP